MRSRAILRKGLAAVGFVLLIVLSAAGQYGNNGGGGQYQILQARYGTGERNVDVTARLKELARRHDGFAIASPEYNGSFSALLKNALDWISRPEPGERHLEVFRGKVAAILSASPGPAGGSRGLRHLRELLEMMSVTVVSPGLAIPRSSQAFDAAGRLVRSEDLAGLHDLASALAQAAIQNHQAAASV